MCADGGVLARKSRRLLGWGARVVARGCNFPWIGSKQTTRRRPSTCRWRLKSKRRKKRPPNGQAARVWRKWNPVLNLNISREGSNLKRFCIFVSEIFARNTPFWLPIVYRNWPLEQTGWVSIRANDLPLVQSSWPAGWRERTRSVAPFLPGDGSSPHWRLFVVSEGKRRKSHLWRA